MDKPKHHYQSKLQIDLCYHELEQSSMGCALSLAWSFNPPRECQADSGRGGGLPIGEEDTSWANFMEKIT